MKQRYNNKKWPKPKQKKIAGLSLQPNFQKGGLDRTSNFRGGDFFREGCNFHIKNKLKSEMFNDKNL